MMMIPEFTRRGRRSGLTNTPTPTPTAPVLVAAAYEIGAAVTMEFDQAIDIGAMSVASVLVDDAPETGWRWEGTGTPSLQSPTTVRVELSIDGEAVGSAITLTAGPGPNVVAAAGGMAWAGVSDVALPYP